MRADVYKLERQNLWNKEAVELLLLSNYFSLNSLPVPHKKDEFHLDMNILDI